MSWIEGVGDEVTVLFVILLLAVLLTLAWYSTHVREYPLHRMIIIDGQRLQQLLSRFTHVHLTTLQNGAVHVRAWVLGNGAAEQSNGSSDNTSNIERTEAETVTTPETGRSKQTHNSHTSSSDPETSTATENLCPGSTCSTDVSSTVQDVDVTSEPCQSTGTSQDTASAFGNTENRTSTDGTSGANQPSQPDAAPSVSQPNLSDRSFNTPVSENNEGLTDSDTTSTRPDDLGPPQDGMIRIKLKYLDERQRLVEAQPDETIGNFKRRVFASELAENIMVRFVFRGRELKRENLSLRSYEVQDNSVIHCLLNRIVQPEPDAAPAGGEFDIGSLMLPLFGLILALSWYWRFTYKQYFNAVSTLSLMGISFLFLVAVLAVYRPQHHAEEAEVIGGNHPHQD